MYCVHLLTACFRCQELTTSLASCSGDPDKEKMSTPLPFAASALIAAELLSDMSSITYHPSPLIVSVSLFGLLF